MADGQSSGQLQGFWQEKAKGRLSFCSFPWVCILGGYEIFYVYQKYVLENILYMK